jgi:pimeloyl-ACP methyl ester carboxylesterase
MTTLLADDGVRLDYTEHGNPDGRPVVLLAGFKAPATSWCYQVPVLAKAGYRVLPVDLRGHGLAERPARVDMDRRGLDLRDVLEGLDLQGAVLVGGSMGASTIWSYVAQCGLDRLAGAVSVDQTPKMLNTTDWTHGFYGYEAANRDSYFAERIPDTGMGTPFAKRGMRLVRLLRAMSGTEKGMTPGELALLHDHATRDWRPVIATADLPVLFVAGDSSEFWPASHAAACAELAPVGTSVVLADDGHAANIEQPKAFNDALLGFLRAL